MPSTTRVQMKRRPDGFARPDDFEVVTLPRPDPREGEVLVQNIWMSVDPYMRRSMDEDGKDLAPWPIGGALDGPSIGRVIASRHVGFREGDLVESMSGWQEHFISGGTDFIPYLTPNDALAVRSAPGARPRDWLGLLGIAAMTAYAGMVCLSKASRGDTTVISSGAGTVGSIACQIGRIKGLRVVTSAGSDEKVKWLRDVARVDEAFNYRSQSMAEALAKACTNGIDLLLENASPEHLSACLPLMNELKQVLITGFISIYNSGGTISGIENFQYVLDRFLTVQAFRFMDSLDAYDQFVSDMLRWRGSGELVLPEIIHNGLEAAPEALCSLFTGASFGKVLVRITDDPADRV